MLISFVVGLLKSEINFDFNETTWSKFSPEKKTEGREIDSLMISLS